MTWIAIALGHFVLVDLLSLHIRRGGASFSTRGMLETMEHTTVDFGALGTTTAFRASAGFSIWISFSLLFLAAAYLLLSRARAVATKPFAWLGVAISATFAVLSYVCFIWPPLVASIAGTALFTASALREA